MTASAVQQGCLRLSSDPNDIDGLIALLDDLLGRCGLDDMAAFRFRCSAYEVFNNCVQHAYRNETGKPIEIHFRLGPSRLVLTFLDRAEMLPELQMTRNRDPLSKSGRGLEIIEAGVDSVRYSRSNGWNRCRLAIGFDQE